MSEIGARALVVLVIIAAGCDRSGYLPAPGAPGRGSAWSDGGPSSDGLGGRGSAEDAAAQDGSVPQDVPQDVPNCAGIGCSCAIDADCDSDHCGPDGVCLAPCAVGPGADVPCDGVDNDCDGQTDEDPCDDGDPCTEGDQCGEAGCAGQLKACDDGQACTADSCVDGACKHTAVSGPCDDGDLCTEADACVDGLCDGTPKACDDGVVCTSDACVDGACQHQPAPGPCDDGDVCTEGDQCDAGLCKGTAKACSDGKACTVDACDPKVGCVFKKVTLTDGQVPSVPYCQGVISWPKAAAAWEEEVVVLVNQARAQPRKCGTKSFAAAGPLSMNGGLRCASRVHSADMASKNYFSHTDLQGKSPGWRIAQTCYGSSFVGENIAGGYASPQKAVEGWLKSPGHCANIMNPAYKGIGVGYTTGGKYKNTWTQTFGNLP